MHVWLRLHTLMRALIFMCDVRKLTSRSRKLAVHNSVYKFFKRKMYNSDLTL